MDKNLKLMSENTHFRCISLADIAVAAKRIDQFDIWEKIANEIILTMKFVV